MQNIYFPHVGSMNSQNFQTIHHSEPTKFYKIVITKSCNGKKWRVRKVKMKDAGRVFFFFIFKIYAKTINVIINIHMYALTIRR